MNKDEIEDIKDNLRTLYKVLWNEHREGTYTIERILEYINCLEQKETILDKVTDKLKETVKKERQLMPYLPHKSVSFHYANGREVLAKEILNILEGEKNDKR